MPKAMSLFLAERTSSRVKIVTGENAVLLEQLRVGDLDLVVGRLAAPEKMTGFSFEHLYSEQVRFLVRTGHPLTDGRAVFEHLADYPVLMPTRNSIIRPFVDRLLITNGIGAPCQFRLRPFPMRSDVLSSATVMRCGSFQKVLLPEMYLKASLSLFPSIQAKRQVR